MTERREKVLGAVLLTLILLSRCELLFPAGGSTQQSSERGEKDCASDQFLLNYVMDELRRKQKGKGKDEARLRAALFRSRGINVSEGFIAMLMRPTALCRADRFRFAEEALPCHHVQHGYVRLYGGMNEAEYKKKIKEVMMHNLVFSPHVYFVLAFENNRNSESKSKKPVCIGLYIDQWMGAHIFIHGWHYSVKRPWVLPELCNRLARKQQPAGFYYMVFTPH